MKARTTGLIVCAALCAWSWGVQAQSTPLPLQEMNFDMWCQESRQPIRISATTLAKAVFWEFVQGQVSILQGNTRIRAIQIEHAPRRIARRCRRLDS